MAAFNGLVCVNITYCNLPRFNKIASARRWDQNRIQQYVQQRPHRIQSLLNHRGFCHGEQLNWSLKLFWWFVDGGLSLPFFLPWRWQCECTGPAWHSRRKDHPRSQRLQWQSPHSIFADGPSHISCPESYTTVNSTIVPKDVSECAKWRRIWRKYGQKGWVR